MVTSILAALTDTAVFRKTSVGIAELATRSQSLQQRFRRALILIDGKKDLAAMSVLLRPGEIEEVFPHLLERGMIELVTELTPAEDSGYVSMVPAARDPQVFAELRARTIERVRHIFGDQANCLVGEIERTGTAEELRIKLRSLEHIFTTVLGDEEGVKLAREIGHALIELVPRSQ